MYVAKSKLKCQITCQVSILKVTNEYKLHTLYMFLPWFLHLYE